MLAWLQGKKSYLISAAMVIVAGLHAQGYMGDSLYGTIQAILVGGGIAALRAGITKAGQ